MTFFLAQLPEESGHHLIDGVRGYVVEADDETTARQICDAQQSGGQNWLDDSVTVATAANGLGDKEIHLRITPPSGRGDPVPSMVGTVTHLRTPGDALVAPSNRPKILESIR